jgi:hypothetical protein
VNLSRQNLGLLLAFLAGAGSAVIFHGLRGGGDATLAGEVDAATPGVRPKVSASPWLADPAESCPLPSSCIPQDAHKTVAMAARIRSLRTGSQGDLALANLMIAGMASRDPGLVLDLLMEPGSAALRRSGLPTLLNVWINTNAAGALDRIRKIELGPARAELEFRFLHALAERDPRLAFKVLQHNGENVPAGADGYNLTGTHFQTFLTWGIKDPGEAEAAIAAITDPVKHQQAMRGLVTAMARENFQGAVDWCHNPGMDPKRSAELLNTVFLQGFQQDGREAMVILKSLALTAGDETVANLIQKNLAAMVELDPGETFAMMLRHSGASGSIESMELFMKRLAGARPNEALEIMGKYLQGSPSGPRSEEIRRSVQEAMIVAQLKADPEAVFASMQKGFKVAPEFERRLMDGLMARDPARTAEIYLRRGKSEDLAGLEAMVGRWAVSDPVGAGAWIGVKVQDKQLKESLQGAVEITGALSEPDRYAATLVGRGDSPANRELARRVAMGLVRSEPTKATQWVETLSSPELYETSVHEISKVWIKLDSMEASKWIAALPVGPARDHAVRNLIQSVGPADPESAARWAELLQHP